MAYIIEIDEMEIEKAFNKIYYLKYLNKFKNIYGEEEFKDRIRKNSLNKNELITYYDAQESFYNDGYLSMDSLTFEFINIFFDEYSEKQIYYQTYGELLTAVKAEESDAIEYYEILTKDYLYDAEFIEELLNNTTFMFTFYIDIVSRAANILLNNNDTISFNKLTTLMNYSFESNFMTEYELDIKMIQKESDEFYVLAIGDPINIIEMWQNIKSFYKLLEFCKEIIEKG